MKPAILIVFVIAIVLIIIFIIILTLTRFNCKEITCPSTNCALCETNCALCTREPCDCPNINCSDPTGINHTEIKGFYMKFNGKYLLYNQTDFTLESNKEKATYFDLHWYNTFYLYNNKYNDYYQIYYDSDQNVIKARNEQTIQLNSWLYTANSIFMRVKDIYYILNVGPIDSSRVKLIISRIPTATVEKCLNMSNIVIEF